MFVLPSSRRFYAVKNLWATIGLRLLDLPRECAAEIPEMIVVE
jgi:hypothetical protein